ncbi:hypothetical protein E4K67_08265 [Desulfosporosinus fructosivorans]|uniref:DUF3794 domain-containing protein n=1 Tax=Desulfosporosinus fructosivorans TaxID=2018669 RepID=A0A4Z0R6E4_9FIRM|nr:hypothetical protein [Desulfosporosinus fructosivorans]TGE37979.1 hypothetical protein E4K67_08265 [Desulfosporosinus fructosivorans]
MTDLKHCPHQWTQKDSFIPVWVSSMPPTTVCPQQNHAVTPNPVFPNHATLPTCTPLEVKKTAPGTVLVTVSIPTESIFTLPTKALEIKMIRKNLRITQCRFFNHLPPVCGIPNDTPKLFLGGFVRKDIQYSEPIRQTATTVEGTIKDFVIDLPFTCVVDLGGTHSISPTLFNQQQEYEFSSTTSLPLGFSPKDKLISGDLNEFNVISQQYFNTSPNCELIYSQINEMDDPLDRVRLPGGPFEEGFFRTVQEKMIILIQLRLTFPTEFNPPHPLPSSRA